MNRVGLICLVGLIGLLAIVGIFTSQREVGPLGVVESTPQSERIPVASSEVQSVAERALVSGNTSSPLTCTGFL